jgi:uncharacterized protein (DUF488 family)
VERLLTTVFTIGHGARTLDEFLGPLREAGVETIVDVRRYSGSRRHPQFGRERLAAALEGEGIAYRHAVELGGRLRGEPGAHRFACLREEAFASYAARMGTERWQEALAAALAEPGPCLMCAETPWWRCHRRLIADLLVSRGLTVRHLGLRGAAETHRLLDVAEARDGRLFLCGELVG